MIELKLTKNDLERKLILDSSIVTPEYYELLMGYREDERHLYVLEQTGAWGLRPEGKKKRALRAKEEVEDVAFFVITSLRYVMRVTIANVQFNFLFSLEDKGYNAHGMSFPARHRLMLIETNNWKMELTPKGSSFDGSVMTATKKHVDVSVDDYEFELSLLRLGI